MGLIRADQQYEHADVAWQVKEFTYRFCTVPIKLDPDNLVFFHSCCADNNFSVAWKVHLEGTQLSGALYSSECPIAEVTTIDQKQREQVQVLRQKARLTTILISESCRM